MLFLVLGFLWSQWTPGPLVQWIRVPVCMFQGLATLTVKYSFLPSFQMAQRGGWGVTMGLQTALQTLRGLQLLMLNKQVPDCREGLALFRGYFLQPNAQCSLTPATQSHFLWGTKGTANLTW